MSWRTRHTNQLHLEPDSSGRSHIESSCFVIGQRETLSEYLHHTKTMLTSWCTHQACVSGEAYHNSMGITKNSKTYNSGYSLVVTHLTTNPPVRCLNRAERTGSLVFNVLWSYVKTMLVVTSHIARQSAPPSSTRSKVLHLGLPPTPTRQA